MKKSIISIALSATLATSALVSTQASAVEGLSANVGSFIKLHLAWYYSNW